MIYWKLKNSDEYDVPANTKAVTVKKFRKNLGIINSKRMLEKVL